MSTVVAIASWIAFAENRNHFGCGFQPFLLGVEHAFRVIQVFARREANQSVVSLGIVFVDEMNVVRTNRTDIVLFSQLAQMFVDLELHGVGLVIGPFDGRLVKLKFQIVIISEQIFVPANGFFRLVEIVGRNSARHFAGQTGRTTYQSFVMLFQLRMIGTGAHIKTLRPCFGDDFYQIVVPCQILGQQNQVVATLIGFALLVLQSATCDIDFASDNGFEIGYSFEVGDLFPADRRIEPELLVHLGEFIRSLLEFGVLFCRVKRFGFALFQFAQLFF